MKLDTVRTFAFLCVATVLLTGCATPAPAQTPAGETPSTPESTAEPVDEAPAEASGRLILATTTSTEDSGLLDIILPDFEQKHGVKVDVIAVGTGQAIEMGTKGDADVLLVHARAKEDEFVASGNGIARYDVMYNDFIIVGPAADPAAIKGLTSAVDAFKQIAESNATFISRGDESGTHTKELGIWDKAGMSPEGDWYISAGQGMGEVLTMSAEQQAYTLADRATYAKRQSEGLALDILVEGDTALFNPYGVIPVNPDKHPNVNTEMAQAFVEWITSLETQELIAGYKVNDTQLFIPSSEAWKAAHP